jgi:glycosyltransferase involved in cell wall biosynthesis
MVGYLANKRRIVVLDLRDAPWYDGPGRTIIEVASGLKNENIDINIATFVSNKIDNADYLEKANERGLDCLKIHETKMFDGNIVRQILEINKSRKIDIIHTHEVRSNIYGLIAAKKLRIPVVSTCHGWIANSLKRRVFAFIDKIVLYIFFDKVITVSDNVAKKLFLHRPGNSRVVTVHNTLETDKYTVSHDHYLRKTYHIPDGVPLIAKIGRLSPEKRQESLILGIKKLVEQGYDCRLLLIGIGPDETHLKKLSIQLGMERYVIFTGFIRDMKPIYSEVDLVVQSSSTEGLPNVILEAMLMRVPVIATDVGGTAEVINSDQVGTLIEADNEQMMTASIKRYLDQPQDFVAKLDAAEQRIKLHFDSEVRLRKMADIYRELTD